MLCDAGADAEATGSGRVLNTHRIEYLPSIRLSESGPSAGSHGALLHDFTLRDGVDSGCKTTVAWDVDLLRAIGRFCRSQQRSLSSPRFLVAGVPRMWPAIRTWEDRRGLARWLL